jgi:transcriptional regulator with XRE-family HTH domain
MKIKSGIGKKIFDARIEKGINQSELSRMVGINRVNVSNWENGKSIPDSKNIEKLSIVLEKPIESFFDNKGVNIEGNNNNNLSVKSENIKNSNISNVMAAIEKENVVIESIEKKLAKILKMKNKGLITEEDYTKKKSELLAKI